MSFYPIKIQMNTPYKNSFTQGVSMVTPEELDHAISRMKIVFEEHQRLRPKIRDHIPISEFCISYEIWTDTGYNIIRQLNELYDARNAQNV
jgi:hypothetical protein